MTRQQEFWTEDRITRLEQVLQKNEGNIYAEVFLSRLAQSPTIEQKRKLIVEEFLPALQHESVIQLWDGKEIPTRLALRVILDDFLYREQVFENVPTRELDTPDEEAERDRLARLFGTGKSAAETVIEDRGPR
jgi:hypothetical protein